MVLESRRRTRSETTWVRATASDLPSGENWNDRIWSDVKVVSQWPFCANQWLRPNVADSVFDDRTSHGLSVRHGGNIK